MKNLCLGHIFPLWLVRPATSRYNVVEASRDHGDLPGSEIPLPQTRTPARAPPSSAFTPLGLSLRWPEKSGTKRGPFLERKQVIIVLSTFGMRIRKARRSDAGREAFEPGFPSEDQETWT